MPISGKPEIGAVAHAVTMPASRVGTIAKSDFAYPTIHRPVLILVHSRLSRRCVFWSCAEIV